VPSDGRASPTKEKDDETAPELHYSSAALDADDASMESFAPTIVGGLFWSSKDTSSPSKTLAYLRRIPPSSPEIRQELAEIYAQIDEYEAAKNQESWITALGRITVLKRFAITAYFGMWLAWCGSGAVVWFGPTVIGSFGFPTTTTGLLASGVSALLNWTAAVFSTLYLAARLGRRTALLLAASLAIILLVTVGAVLGTHPVNPHHPKTTASGIVLIVLIYMIGIVCAGLFGGFLHIYYTELFPLHLRDAGMMTFALFFWGFNFLASKYLTIGFAVIAYKFWFVFAAANVVGFFIVFFLCPETKGKSLEDIDILFGAVTAQDREAHVQAELTNQRISVRQA